MLVQVSGTVQGVGFRPHVYRLATSLGLTGLVRNDDRGVRIEVEGAASDVDRFLGRLRVWAPSPARVLEVVAEEICPADDAAFAILASDGAAARTAVLAADAATCAACLAELRDPADRRFRYPFVTCTACGPRFTAVREAPYDRARTTMAGFAMCAACRAEYADPADRRFHHQANACPACGPSVRLVDATGRATALGAAHDAVAAAAAALGAGAIVAVKALGGFHLACRADDAPAVERLRARKRREAKPFAVMVGDVAAARRLVRLDAAAAAVLMRAERPIVLVARRAGAALAAGVAPAQADLGVMLPSTPLHHLLLADARTPLVMTSGNRSEEPIACDDDEALERLAGVADAFLLHDRPIAARADDSVVRMVRAGGARRPLPIRRARGFVPGAMRLPVAAPEPVLAVGGELKCACAVARADEVILTPHLGDLGEERTYRAFLTTLEHFGRLLGVAPRVVAHDLHPGYRSTGWARRLAATAIGVQHHHAHVASCLADNGLAGPAIGVAWDGTGLGTDGHVWGGEFLVADLRGFERHVHLEEVPLPGGEAAIREPWRMAAAFLHAAYGEDATRLDLAFVRGLDRAAWRVLVRGTERGLNAPVTSSAGRLFDGVAALLGLGARVSFEGQAAMALEAAAEPRADREYPVRCEPGVVRTTDLVRGVVGDLLAGVPTARIAARFHATLAAVVVRVCVGLRARTGLGRVALTGGVFQNAWLLGAAAAGLEAAGFAVLCHTQVPPNDGGLALGQAAVAAARLVAGEGR